MSWLVTADHPDGWLLAVSDDEPAALAEQAALVTRQVREGLRGIPGSNTLAAWYKAAKADSARAHGEPTEAMRVALYAMASDLLLDRDDRLALAEVVLNREVDSWKSLSLDEARRLLDQMSGYVHVRHLRLERQPNEGASS